MPTPARVLIPVDRERQPAGDKVYVPESLYRQLVRQAATDESHVSGWLVETAAYQGELTWKGTPKRLVAGPIHARFRIRVFTPSCTIRVPLSRAGLSFAPDWALLDGRVIRPEWDASGDAFHFVVPTEGSYRLEVVFSPGQLTPPSGARRETSLQEGRGFNVGIPRVLRSRLELSLPANAPTVEVPSALGHVNIEGQQLLAQVGATDQLRVRWRADAGRRDTEPLVEVDELLMMNLTPGSVSLDTRFRFKVLEGRMSEIRLTVDPRLKLRGEPSTGQIEALPGAPGSFRVKLPKPQAEDFTYRAQFSLRNTSGVGHHRLPLVRVDNARVARRWFAVSVDNSLEWTEPLPADVASATSSPGTDRPNRHSELVGQGAASLQRIAIPDFLAVWGGTDRSLRLAYRLLGESSGWSITTRPRPPRTVVDQRVTAALGHEHAEIRYEAFLGRTPGYGFRYRLRVPRALQVDTLTVREQDADCRVRWSRAQDGSIDVALSTTATTRRHLILKGHMSTPAEGRFELPIPIVADAYLQSCHVTLLRESSVLVELDRYEGLEEAETEVATPDQADLGFLAVSMINSGDKRPRLWLHLSPNRPKLDVLQTLSMAAVQGKWFATADFEIKSRGGLADEIRLALPPNLAGPPEVRPSLPVIESMLPDGRKELTVCCPRPLIDGYRFSLSIPLSSERVSVPDLVVEEADTQERYLILPRRLNDRPLRWDTQGIEKMAFTSETITYRIVGEQFRATLIPGHATGRGSRVYLSDTQLAWRTDGAVHGVTRFDVEPGGRTWAPLVMPEGYQLVHVFVDGAPTDPVPASDDAKEHGGRRFQISLGPPTLPRRVAVVFTGRVPETGRRSSVTFDAPRLGNLPVDKSIWLVACPDSYELCQRTASLRPLVDVLRADSLTRMLQLAAQSKSSDSDKRLWLAAWQGRFRQLLSVLDRHLVSSRAGETMQPVDKTLEGLRQQWRSLESLLGDPVLRESDASAAPEGDTVGGFWQDLLDRQESVFHLGVVNGQEPLTLHYGSKKPSWIGRHVPALLPWFTLFLLTYLAVRHGVLRVFVCRWPQGVVVVVGFAWWLWMVPSILGLGIALGGVWLTIRSLWSKRRGGDSVLIPIK